MSAQTPQPGNSEPTSTEPMGKGTATGGGRKTVTVTQVAVACIPVLLIIFTPVFPFANEPGLIFGVPTMIVWMAALVVAIVVILQIIDLQITRREDALPTSATTGEDHS